MNHTTADARVLDRPGIPGGMLPLDTSANPRIPMLMELVGALSRAREPQEVLRTFSAGMRRLHGPQGYVSLSTRGLRPGEYRITRLMPEGDPESIASVDSWSDLSGIPVHRGGFFGALIRSAYPEIIHHLDLRDDPAVGDALRPFRSLMAVPLFDDGEPVNWSVLLRREPEAFDERELEEWILRSNLVGGTVRNTIISRELRSAHQAIHREVDRIAAIQRALLPPEMPSITGVRLAACYQTFDRAGGDYYDFLPQRNRNGRGDPDAPWALLIADASGHGPAAAVVMAMLQALLHAYPRLDGGPAEVLEHVNRHLCDKRIESSFVTALFALYDPPTRVLRYARAGHNPPLLKNEGPGGAVQRLDDVGGVPLGIIPDTTYEVAERGLTPGQSLVLYTDGISEAMNPEGVMFGVGGIERALHDCTGEPECVVNSIGEALRAHEQSVQPSDDQTIVVMKVDGGPGT